MRTYLTEKRGITFCRRFLPGKRCVTRQRMVLARAILAVILAASLSSFCFAEARGLDQLKQAEMHLQQADKEYDAALEVCKELIKSHPDLEPKARLLMSRIYVKKGKWNDAAIEAKKVVKKFPDSDEALRGLKLIYQAHISAGHPQGAEAWILPLVEGVFVPAGRGDEALERLCNIYFDMNELEKVLATATRLIETYPDSPQVKRAVSYIRSVYQRRAGDEAGLTRLREFVTLHPKSYLASCAQYDIGRVYAEKEDRSQAIKEHEKFMREYPDSLLAPQVQEELGKLYYYEGKIDRAIVEFRKRLDLFDLGPEDRGEAYRQLGAVYFRKHEYDKAIEQYRAVLKIKGLKELWYPFAESFIANSYREKGEYDRAIKVYREIISKYSSIGISAPMAQYKIGYTRSLQGDYEGALKAYQRVLDEYPNSSWVIRFAKKRMARVREQLGKATP